MRRRKGTSEGAILAALLAENAVKCGPPLDEAEVATIAASIMRYPASDTGDIVQTLNDTGNARRFEQRHASQVLYAPGMGWFIWDGLRWHRDGVGKITELAKEVGASIYTSAASAADDHVRTQLASHAKASLQAPRLKAMVELSQSIPVLSARTIDLDAHDMLLGVANGVLNLRTGKLQAADQKLRMTRHSPVAFDAKASCPVFEQFLNQVTGGKAELQKYLQRVVGYSLTGETKEQCLFFLHGSGSNGKSTFLNVLKDLVGGDLACQTPSETLMVKRNQATNDIARLQSVRAVIANEIEEGSLLAESLVKQMTGGEKLTARFHYQEFFEFDPKFKLFIAGNHKPVIRGRDNGIWRRIRLIPFEVSIPKAQQDKDLQRKLTAELPGILNWALKGCKSWQKTGLSEPTVITEAVDAYREDMDIFKAWLADRCDISPSFDCRAQDAYRSYKVWSEDNGYRPMAAGNFGRDLAAQFKRVPRKDGNYYLGLKCRM